MTITLGQLTFDHATYDERGDVLYLHAGEPQAAADADETRKATRSATPPTAG